MKGEHKYDFLIVGAGMYGAASARLLADRGRKVLVLEKRDHIAGNAYTEDIDGICVQRYGPHVFHTDSESVWNFVNRFARFNGFVNQPLANYKGELYSLPFNMNTFREMWGVDEPGQAEKIIQEQIHAAGYGNTEPANLEEQAISQVGTDIYEKLIRGYTEKQWGRPCRELPASIIRRIPVRYEFNNNYYDDRYQGIPVNGYTAMVAAMLEGIDVVTGVDYLEGDNREYWGRQADRLIFSGQIDAYYDYRYGPLEYRSLKFESETVDLGSHADETGTPGKYYQKRAVINYTDIRVPWTRIIEHRHFAEDTEMSAKEDRSLSCRTIITREFPFTWKQGDEAFYPVNDEKNQRLYEQYLRLADEEKRVIFGGRIGNYKYYDMDDVILAAMEDTAKLL